VSKTTVSYARARIVPVSVAAARRKWIIDQAFIYAEQRSDELLSLDEALLRLAKVDPRQSRIVELRFFGGLDETEIAGLLGLSPRTVKRDWSVAKAWLSGEMRG
jgi:RNA polymerase sigma factor (TIGR02999 family)